MHGDVPPDEFIPLAEEVGAIVEIGEWVLRAAASDLAGLSHRGRELRQLFVNVSAHQLTDCSADFVARVTSEWELEPGVLTLEITESAMPSLQGNRALQDVRRAGVPVATDDFGSGFSSLAQLALLHVDILKMDRDLIRAMNTTNGRRVVDSVIALANELGLTTVAEGVETPGEAAVLRQSACARTGLPLRGAHAGRRTSGALATALGASFSHGVTTRHAASGAAAATPLSRR